MATFTMTTRSLCRISLAAITTLALASATPARADPLNVCATTPDLGSLAQEVGGSEVDVHVFTKGTQDPHFVEPRPSFIKDLSQADLFIQVGLDLEIGWAPALLKSARNGRVLPGAPGFLDASASIAPLGVATGTVDRSLGDVHPMGNPHYLLDPINGLKVARAIRDKLVELRPEKKDELTGRLEAFTRKLGVALVGERLAAKYDAEKLAALAQLGKLDDFLSKQGDGPLEGWLGRLGKLRGTLVVGDHDQWPYFARRFGLEVVGFLEPRPGVAPTTKHLGTIIALMRSRNVKLVFSVPYFDERHGRFVASETGAAVVPLAHQTSAYPDASDYLSAIEHNVHALEAAAKAPGE